MAPLGSKALPSEPKVSNAKRPSFGIHYIVMYTGAARRYIYRTAGSATIVMYRRAALGSETFSNIYGI